jgi:hypothetical protein
MSMDPDGTNRIIRQQIREWYAEIDEGRNAKLVERSPRRSPLVLLSSIRHALGAGVNRLGSLRTHRPEASVAVTRAEGTSPR